MVFIELSRKDFNIFRDEETNEVIATLNIPENNLEYDLIIDSLFEIEKLFINSFSNIHNIKIEHTINKPTIILDNLRKLSDIILQNSDITLILGNNLNYINKLSKINSSSSQIIGNTKILNSLNIKYEKEFTLDEKFSDIENLTISDCNLYLPFKKYDKLEYLYFFNVKGKFDNIDFKNVNYLHLYVKDKLKCEFNNCNFESVETLELILSQNSKVKEIHINSIFSNLKKIRITSISLKRVKLIISDKNPDIQEFKVDTNVEISGNLVKHLQEDIKYNYNIILPKRKNPYKKY